MKPRFVILSAAALLAGVAGCSEPKAEFSLNKTTDELIPPAREVVEKQLAENFGTPEELVAWLKFPIDYGVEEVEQVTVASFDTSSKGVLEINPPGGTNVLSEETLLRLSDKSTHHLSGFDADTGTLYVKPPIDQELDVDEQVTLVTKQAGWKLKRGRKLYMQHCVHCHGVSGDGNGPTAQYLTPRPRDYRPGIFKFTSTISGIKAAHGDLVQTLYDGIPGTSMPSFKLKLIGDDMDAVVAYILYLSTRGEFEIKLGGELKILGGGIDEVDRRVKDENISRKTVIDEFLAQDELGEGLPDLVNDVATIIAEAWEEANTPEVVVWPESPRPEPTPESIARGRELYLKVAKCSDCHGVQGYGDGKQTEAYQQLPGSTLTYDKPGMYDIWGNPLQPRNLHQGIYRGGRRPIDLYRRVSAGIKGALMPGFSTLLNDQQRWDVVNYVMSLPYEDESAEEAQAEQAVAEHTVK